MCTLVCVCTHSFVCVCVRYPHYLHTLYIYICVHTHIFVCVCLTLPLPHTMYMYTHSYPRVCVLYSHYTPPPTYFRVKIEITAARSGCLCVESCMCWSVLECVGVCGGVLQRVAERCSVVLSHTDSSTCTHHHTHTRARAHTHTHTHARTNI